MSGPDKPSLEKEARRLFLRASRELPPEVEARLDRARRRAVTGTTPRSRLANMQRQLLWPAGALTISCALLLIWQPGSRTVTAPMPSMQPSAPARVLDADNDLPPDATQNDAGMYRDLAFYNWLATDAPASAH